MLASFAKLQDRFGDRLGKDLYLISISVDPTQDTPGRLKYLSSQLRARPGWYFLTGDKENVEFALSKLGLKVDSKEQHSNIFLIGNDATTLWKKVKGLARPDEVMAVVEGVIDDQVPSPDEPEAGPAGANAGPVGGGGP
jgi:protein SCO1/2